MKCRAIIVFFLLLGTVIGVFGPIASSDGDTEISVWVMVDFGNGEVEWAKVGLSDNHTGIKATEDACQKLGLSLTVSWGQWGAFVSEIGGAAAPFDYSWWWGIFIWNHSQNSWESSSYGASSIELEDGDILGWTPAWDFLEPAKPLATPSMKFPWMQFRHDATNSGLAKNLGPRNNSVSWIFDTETKELASSPVVAGEKIVINNWGGVFCLNLDGETLWHNKDVLGGFSPAVAYDSVFIGGKDGYLYSLNFTNGEILWSTKITAYPGISGVTSPPTIDKGKVYVGAFNFSGGVGSLFCLDAKTGYVLWENETSSSIYFSSPAVYDDKVFVGTMGRYNSSSLKWNAPYDFYSFNAKNGELIWNFAVEGPIGSSAALIDNKVLFTSKDGNLYCLNSETGDQLWKKEIGSSVSSPAIMDDTVFVGSGDLDGEGNFYAFDLNGNILWEFTPNGAVQGSPAVSGDFVYFATNVKKGTVYCLHRYTGKLAWEYTPWPNQYILSSPAIVDKRLYISSDNGRMYCFGGNGTIITLDLSNSVQDIHIGEDVIFIHNEKVNKMKLTGFSENKVIIKMDSLDEEFEVTLNKIIKVDTDSDGKDDMTVLVSDLNSDTQTAHLTLDVYEEIEHEEDSRVFLAGIIVLVIIVIFIIAGILVNLKRRR